MSTMSIGWIPVPNCFRRMTVSNGFGIFPCRSVATLVMTDSRVMPPAAPPMRGCSSTMFATSSLVALDR
jgi:hypothetical protein